MDLLAPIRRYSDTLRHLRTCLFDRDFVEAATPVARASQVPIGNRPKVDLGRGKYLRTMIGPALRSTLAHYDRVFEIGPCFRNDAPDETHSPEFTMLDLYAAGESYQFLLDLALALIAPATHGQILTISVADIVREASGVDLRLESVEVAMPALAAAAGCDLKERPSRIVDAFIEKIIEPQTIGCTAILCDYPVGGSEPCARVKPGTVGVASRFEIFIDGLEVVHGYEDEVDTDVFIERATSASLFDDDQRRVVEEIRQGVVPGSSVGMGIGIERLCMAIDGSNDIWRYRFSAEF